MLIVLQKHQKNKYNVIVWDKLTIFQNFFNLLIVT